MVLPLQSVGDLRSKYAEILAMRLAHADGSEDTKSVPSRMAALALRFPGALREIDRLELAELRARIAGLDAVLAGDRDVDSWMIAGALFHAFMRGALCAKRWLGGDKRVDEERKRTFASDLVHLPFPDDARAWIHQLDAVALPPGGRVTWLVYARIGEALGTSATEARRLVFVSRAAPRGS